METKASAKFIRMSPKKVRLVVDTVRDMKITEALDRLRLTNKAATRPIVKLINSAVADAEHNFELEKNNLFIKEIRVDEGPTLKRWKPRAHGRAAPIRKRTSHIQVILAEIKDTGIRKGRKPETGEIVKLKEQPKKDEAVKVTDAKRKPRAEISPAPEKEQKPVAETVDKSEPTFAPTDAKALAGKKATAGKEVYDPRREGRRGHARAEGGRKGFMSRIFRRKSG